MVKVGTSVVSHATGYVALGRVGFIVEQLAWLQREGKEVLLVSSGAVGIGRQKLRHQMLLSSTLRSHFNPDSVDSNKLEAMDPRACAAAGQSGLMAMYDSMFQQHDVQCAQVLVTEADFRSQQRRDNLRSTLNRLLALKVIPILNENDVISERSTPIRDQNNAIFWDNDSLAALLAVETSFDLLIILSDVEGLYVRPPSENDQQKPIPTFHVGKTMGFEIGQKSRVGRGGMQAKIEAAASAVERGIPFVVIANGYRPNTIRQVMAGETVGTLFTALKGGQGDSDEDAVTNPKTLRELAENARNQSRILRELPSAQRIQILEAIADSLATHEKEILAANQEDVEEAQTTISEDSLRARLVLSREKLGTLQDGIRAIARQEEPLGRVLRRTEIAGPDLELCQLSVPLGVLLFIFESRPDVLPQVTALAIRSGNAVILKGGKEAQRTNRILHQVITRAIESVTGGVVNGGLLPLIKSRDEVAELLKLDDVIDLVIPRGSGELVKQIKQTTHIPVLGHAEGVCHLYVDKDANLDKAKRIALDSKCNYPAACNSIETLLFHRSLCNSGSNGVFDCAAWEIIRHLQESGKVKVVACPKAHSLWGSKLELTRNLREEFSGLVVKVEIVEDVEEALQFIHQWGSGHTESIVTENPQTAERFLTGCDSSGVFWNCSTRFADGYRMGLGAEVGISTGRIHARGPVGIEGLLTTKWVLKSQRQEGHCVGDFASSSPQQLQYTHRPLPISRL